MSQSNQSQAFQPMISLVGQVIAAKRPVNTILYTKQDNSKGLALAKLAALKSKF